MLAVGLWHRPGVGVLLFGVNSLHAWRPGLAQCPRAKQRSPKGGRPKSHGAASASLAWNLISNAACAYARRRTSFSTRRAPVRQCTSSEVRHGGQRVLAAAADVRGINPWACACAALQGWHIDISAQVGCTRLGFRASKGMCLCMWLPVSLCGCVCARARVRVCCVCVCVWRCFSIYWLACVCVASFLNSCAWIACATPVSFRRALVLHSNIKGGGLIIADYVVERCSVFLSLAFQVMHVALRANVRKRTTR